MVDDNVLDGGAAVTDVVPVVITADDSVGGAGGETDVIDDCIPPPARRFEFKNADAFEKSIILS